METATSDAIVFFGATGDLAYEQIFPALLGLVGEEGLNVPIVGVAKAGWNSRSIEGARRGQHRQARKTQPRRPQPAPDAASLRRRRLQRSADLREPARDAGVRSSPAALSGDPAEPVRGCRLRARQKRPQHGCARRGREALRPRSGVGARAQPDAARIFSRADDLSHRSLPRQGAGSEHSLHPVRQLDIRAAVEPPTCAQHPDHDGGSLRRARSRELLRRDRRPARRGAEPHAAGARQSDDGAADWGRPRSRARSEGGASQGGSAARRGEHRARTVSRLPVGQRRPAGFDHRDICRGEALRRQLALGRRACLHPRGQEPRLHSRRGDYSLRSSAPLDFRREDRRAGELSSA